MHKFTLHAGLGMMVALSAASASALVSSEPAGGARTQTYLQIAPGGTVSIVNSAGGVNIHSASGRQVMVIAVTWSAKMEVDQNTTPDKRRVEIITHVKPGETPVGREASVSLDIAVPAGVSIMVSTATAPITVDGVSGEMVSLSSDTGQITARNVMKSHVHVRSVTAPVILSGVNGGDVEVTTAGGAVQMANVYGPLVNVGTTSGGIAYQGDCSGGGAYKLTTYSGAIDVSLLATASVDLTARSVNGVVQNDFPLQQKAHTSFVPKAGSSFAGTSLSGSSSLELQSFSGKIRVKKQ